MKTRAIVDGVGLPVSDDRSGFKAQTPDMLDAQLVEPATGRDAASFAARIGEFVFFR